MANNLVMIHTRIHTDLRAEIMRISRLNDRSFNAEVTVALKVYAMISKSISKAIQSELDHQATREDVVNCAQQAD